MTTQNIAPSEQLVPVFLGTINDQSINLCDARALHTYLESKRQFADWIKERIEKYGFEENQDFVIHKFVKQLPSGAKQVVDYHLTLDMAKELAMVENNAKGREIRRYFIKMERLALDAIPHVASIQPNSPTALHNLADASDALASAAHVLADMARVLAASHASCDTSATQMPQSPQQPQPQTQSLIPPREIAFIQAWWDCLGSQTVTASDLYRAVATKQCQELNDKSSALLGDISQWTPKKLSHALRRWSQTILNGYAVQNIGRTSHGILWRLQLLLT